MGIVATFAFIFIGEVSLNLSGSIVQDMADATSTEAALINSMKMMEEQENVTEEVVMEVNRTSCDHSWEMYRSLQYSFFSNSGVEVVGGVLFLLTAIFIVRDKLACELAVSALETEEKEEEEISY